MSTDTAGDRQAQWLRGVLDLAVLAALEREGEGYGYVLLRALADKGLGDIKGGTLYPLLNRLQRDGLVTSTWRTSDSGPARKYFSITAQGRQVLDAGRTGWARFSHRVDAALAPDTETGSVTDIHTARSAR